MHITYREFSNKEEIMECSDAHIPKVGEKISLYPNPAEWKVIKVVYTYESSNVAKYTNRIKSIDIYIETKGLGF